MSFCIHLVVLLLPDSWSNWNLEKLVFEERGKLQYYPGKNQEQRGEPTNHQLTFSDTLLSNKNKKDNNEHTGTHCNFSSEKFWLEIYTDWIRWFQYLNNFHISRSCSFQQLFLNFRSSWRWFLCKTSLRIIIAHRVFWYLCYKSAF